MQLSFKDLTREYDGKRVLDITEGSVAGGSRTAVVGPNGSGKSTLLNIIAGLDRPTTGKVFYGTDRQELDEVSRDITMVFQKPYLITASVEKNIAYPMKIRDYGDADIEKRVAELCQELGLTELRKRRSWKLSGGEIQKVSLARALSFQPKLLLLDEPTANIDPATTAEIERILLKINNDFGTTIIFVTHNLAQARRVCNRIIFLNKGQLIEEGPCSQVLISPREELTQRFIAGELLY